MYIYILLSALKGTVAGNFLFKEEEGMLKIGKKVISAVLTLCIVCSVFSVTAFAESESAVGGQGVQTNIGDDMNIRGTNSFGSMVTSELEQESDKQEENNGFNIFSVEVTGKTATAEFETLQDSTLVVAIYDESGVEMLASGKAEVKKEDKTAEVTIDIETMPKYFYLRAFLVDEEVYRPLCSAYESPNYTQEMQEFFAKTTDDFESDKVLNLDSDKANNFAVYDEETKIIEQNGNKNQVASVDDEGQKYVIENADSSITSLKAGDIFSYNYGDDELLIVKVKSISVSGTTATIYGDEVELDEVFDYVKIDENADLSNAEVDPSTCDEGVTYEGMNEESDPEGLSSVGASIEGSMSKSISLKIKSLVEGGIDLKVEAKTKVYVTLQYQYVEFSIDYSVKISVAVKVDIIDAKIRLASIAISPVPGLYIELTPSIVFEGNVKVELSGTLKGSIGIRATGDTGIENISKTPSFKTELKVEGTFFVGLSMEPRVGIVGSIATIGLEAKAGAEIKASLSIYNSDDYKLTPSVKHDCKKCVAGTISAKFSLSGDVCFLKMDKLKYKKTFLESKIKLCDFYYSFDFNEFAFTTCPHQKYKVTVTVKDSKGDPVSGATVNNDYTTNDDGVAELYLNAGQYNITASKAGAGDAKKSITIADYSKSITLKLSEKLTDFRIIEDFNQEIGNVNRISLGNSHSGAITENGDLYMWGYNGHGQLGNGASTQRLTPTKIMSNVKAVGLGYDHSAAITESGDLYTWGDNYYGQLGDGTTTDRYTPTKIMSNVKAVSLGHHHSAAITENGDLYMWGDNEYGKIGDGTTDNRYTPTKIMSHVKAVSLGGYHSGAITENGDLYMWGDNEEGELGDGTTDDIYTPTKIMSNVKTVSLGWIHSAAITEGGDLYMWGENSCGELGDGTRIWRYTPTEIMNNVKSVSLGDLHSGAITENGDLYMWGSNWYGLLGDGTTTDRYTPTKIMNNVKSVSLGDSHSGAITEKGNLYMWGMNFNGRLGDGTRTDRNTPTKITIPSANEKLLETVSASGDCKTETFTNLQPNEAYNFYSMKTKDAENPFGSVNLLYITQATADKNGNLSITYKPDESCDKAVNFVVPLKQIDLSTATVTMDNLNYNGQTQYVKPVVTLNGKTLTDGEDYDLSGDYFAKDAGSYILTINGRGLYTGEIDFNYTVIVPDKFGDVNLDGQSDIQDVTQLQRYLAHMISFNDEQEIIADVNGDGMIAIDDATIIQIYLAEYSQLV